MTTSFTQSVLFSPPEALGGDVAQLSNWVVDVFVDAEKAGYTPYTYALAADVDSSMVQTGSVVTVAFGHQQAVQGFVLAVRQRTPEDPATLKTIAADAIETGLFSQAYWAVLQAISRYTVTPMARVIQAALPPNLVAQATPVWQATDNLTEASLKTYAPAAQPMLQHLLSAGEQGATLVGLCRALRMSKGQCQKQLASLKSAGVATKGLRFAQASQGSTVLSLQPVARAPLPKTARQQAALAAINTLYDTFKQPIAKALAVTELPAVTDSMVAALVAQGCIKKAALPAHQVVSSLATQPIQSLPTLTASQQAVVETMTSGKPAPQPWLLHGVTGSGKTAVYMHLIRQALDAGKQALVLVPEITLTGQLAKRLQAVFPNTVVWHSNIAHGERLSQWYRVQSGEPLLIIGARSAALLSLDNVQLMVMDEAHDASFKQESPEPRYHAQWVCRQWLQRQQSNNGAATLVLGSATPDVGDMTNAMADNRVLALTERYGQQSLATVAPIDLRQPVFTEAEKEQTESLSDEKKEEPAKLSPSKPSPLAPQTIAALKETIAAGQQAMVLINRRGYHTLIQCQGCGSMHQCPHCDVSLTLHQPVRASSTAIASKSGGHVLCHHCGYRDGVPDYCPQCASRQLKTLGTGSQRVVETLEAALPGARIARLDRDVQQKRHAPDAILNAFANHQADILVGTQMIAKGLDIANVTLVAVLQADAGLMLPDYRSSERTFQLLTQVAGRAGRGALAGKVLVQTWQPEHPIIEMAMGQDYRAFYGYESAIREKHGFPPYSQLFRFVVRSEEETMTQATATALAAHARQAFIGYPDWPIQILGPAPCVLSRIQGWFRWHVLVKINTQNSTIRQQAHGILSALYQQLTTRSGVSVLLDVDSLSLL